MRIACSQCANVWEFPAADIPDEGYHAQCTTCHHIFFVARQPDPESVELPPGQVGIRCQFCQFLYTFAAEQVPEAGYEAECTRCRSAFWVSRQALLSASAEADAPEPAAAKTSDDLFGASAVAEASSPPRGFAPQTLAPGTFGPLTTDPNLGVVPVETAVSDAVVPAPSPSAASTAPSDIAGPPASTAPSDIAVPPENATPSDTAVPHDTAVPPGTTAPSDAAVATSSARPPDTDAPPSSAAPPAGGPVEENGDSRPEPAAPPTSTPPPLVAMPSTQAGPAAPPTTAPPPVGPPAVPAERRATEPGEVSMADEQPRPRPSGRQLHPTRRRSRLGRYGGVAAALVAVAAVGAAILVWGRPDVRPGPQGAASRLLPAEAAALEEGRRALLEDTEAGYRRAEELFWRQQSEGVPTPAAAAAGAVVALFLAGVDQQEAGSLQQAAWAREQAQLRGLVLRQREGDVLDAAGREQVERLQQRAPAQHDAAIAELEAGAQKIGQARTQGQRARQRYPDAADVAAAAALSYSIDPRDAETAQRLATEAERAGDRSRPNPWLRLAQGRLLAQDSKTTQEAQAAFEAAYQAEPGMVRALWEQVALAMRSDPEHLAERRARLAQMAPEHPKAHLLDDTIAGVPRPPAAAGPPGAGDGTVEAPAPAHPSRRRHRRGHRAAEPPAASGEAAGAPAEAPAEDAGQEGVVSPPAAAPAPEDQQPAAGDPNSPAAAPPS